jgi:hypothetical protein
MTLPPPQAPEYVPNNLVWGILTTLFCCLPFGIVSIVYAARVDGKRAAGDIEGARNDARLAANWAIVSAVSFPIVFMMLLALGALGSLLGA